MNAIDIQARRALVFKYWCLELTPLETFKFINPKYPTSVETIRRDLRNMSQWLPQLTSLEEGEIDGSMYRIMGQMRMAQKRVTALMFSNNDSVACGASKALHAMASKEAELRMDLGRVHRVPLAIQHSESIDLEGLDERAIAAIVQNFMDDERMRAQQDMVEPSIHPDGVTAVEVSQRQGHSAPTSNLMDSGLTPPRPHGCDGCRLWEKPCAGPKDSDLDDMGKCIHIQPWIQNRRRGLSA